MHFAPQRHTVDSVRETFYLFFESLKILSQSIKQLFVTKVSVFSAIINEALIYKHFFDR